MHSASRVPGNNTRKVFKVQEHFFLSFNSKQVLRTKPARTKPPSVLPDQWPNPNRPLRGWNRRFGDFKPLMAVANTTPHMPGPLPQTVHKTVSSRHPLKQGSMQGSRGR